MPSSSKRKPPSSPTGKDIWLKKKEKKGCESSIYLITPLMRNKYKGVSTDSIGWRRLHILFGYKALPSIAEAVSCGPLPKAVSCGLSYEGDVGYKSRRLQKGPVGCRLQEVVGYRGRASVTRGCRRFQKGAASYKRLPSVKRVCRRLILAVVGYKALSSATSGCRRLTAVVAGYKRPSSGTEGCHRLQEVVVGYTRLSVTRGCRRLQRL